MVDKNIFKLKGKSQEQVKEAFLEFLKIDNIKPGGYASVGSNKVISEVAKEACGVNSVLDIKKAEDATEVSKLLTAKIDEEQDYGKRHQMASLRCHVRKYIDFLDYCERLIGKPIYDFGKDPDKPFINAAQFKKIVSLLRTKKNIILEGAPGVGKTFLARKIAYQLIGYVKDENIEMVQFHQSYSYEDFVQGIRPSEEGGFERKNGIFFDFCSKARRSPDQQFVFIIDEINRGNISKILGELMMLIEADKRKKQYAIKLTYSNEDDERFFVPENVYLIGCMNTADRSLAIVDYALRRRFRFCPIKPEFNEAFIRFLKEKGISQENAELVVSKVKAANEVISSMDRGLEIGHSYFCQTDGCEDFSAWWNDICEYELFPYLREICFDDEDKYELICNKLKF